MSWAVLGWFYRNTLTNQWSYAFDCIITKFAANSTNAVPSSATHMQAGSRQAGIISRQQYLILLRYIGGVTSATHPS